MEFMVRRENHNDRINNSEYAPSVTSHPDIKGHKSDTVVSRGRYCKWAHTVSSSATQNSISHPNPNLLIDDDLVLNTKYSTKEQIYILKYLQVTANTESSPVCILIFACELYYLLTKGLQGQCKNNKHIQCSPLGLRLIECSVWTWGKQ